MSSGLQKDIVIASSTYSTKLVLRVSKRSKEYPDEHTKRCYFSVGKLIASFCALLLCEKPC